MHPDFTLQAEPPGGQPITEGLPRIDQVFDDVVAQWGERPALEIGPVQVSYRELQAHAYSLSIRMRAAGVGHADTVAIACTDILSWSAGLLAAWRLGAAAVPLEARYPVARAAEILRDSGARLLIAPAEFPPELVPEGIVRLCPPQPGERPASGVEVATPGPERSAEDVAYICYTSGSTGKPKGIRVAHRGIPILARDRGLLEITHADRMAQCCSFAFDVSQYELWAALLNGACLVSVPRGMLTNAAELAEFLATRRITAMCPTTALFNALSLQRPQLFGGVGSVIIAGEAADASAVARVLRSGAPPGRVVNAYGPTEATVYASWHEVTATDLDAGVIPIGRAISGTSLAVLDEARQPVADGQTGELYIGGPGVAHDYINLPDLTAERFVWLHTAQGRQRYYRSGDLVCRRADGALVYLGRADDQLKISGHRVEPAEVAAALRTLPGVRDAVVLGMPASFGSKVLVAAVIATPEFDARGWRTQVERLLPPYLVPKALRCVDGFALTTAGKIDRQALLALFAPGSEPGAESGVDSGSGADTGERPGVPDSEAAQAIMAWWQAMTMHDMADAAGPLRRTLGQSEQTLGDDPEALRALDSMQLMQLAIQVENRFGVEIGVEDLRPGTTLRSLAASVEARRSASAAAAHASRHAPASPAATGQGAPATVLVLAYPWRLWRWPEEIPSALAQGHEWHQIDVPLALLSRPGTLTVEEIAEELVNQIAARRLPGPYIVCGHSFCGVLAYEVAQRLVAVGRDVSWLVMLDALFRQPQTRGQLALGMAMRVQQVLARGPSAWLKSLRWHARSSSRRLAWRLGLPAHDLLERCRAAMQRYEPAPYKGRAIVFTARPSPDDHGLLKAAERPELFSGIYREIKMDCDHREMMDSAQCRASIAARLTIEQACCQGPMAPGADAADYCDSRLQRQASGV